MSHNFTYTSIVDTTYLSGQQLQDAINWNNQARQLIYAKQQQNRSNDYWNYNTNGLPVSTGNWGGFSNGSPVFSSSYLG
jgi:hypothetical protein